MKTLGPKWRLRATYLILREMIKALADPAEHACVPWENPHGEKRCLECGHRQGDNVIATRYLPLKQILREPHRRAMAILYGERSQ